MGFLPWKFRVAFPGESQLRQSRATKPTVHAWCFCVSVIHRTVTFNVRTDVNECDRTRGCTDTRKRVCTESWLWEKSPSPHLGIEPAAAACRSDALPTELHPSHYSLFRSVQTMHTINRLCVRRKDWGRDMRNGVDSSVPIGSEGNGS